MLVKGSCRGQEASYLSTVALAFLISGASGNCPVALSLSPTFLWEHSELRELRANHPPSLPDPEPCLPSMGESPWGGQLSQLTKDLGQDAAAEELLTPHRGVPGPRGHGSVLGSSVPDTEGCLPCPPSQVQAWTARSCLLSTSSSPCLPGPPSLTPCGQPKLLCGQPPGHWCPCLTSPTSDSGETPRGSPDLLCRPPEGSWGHCLASSSHRQH